MKKKIFLTLFLALSMVLMTFTSVFASNEVKTIGTQLISGEIEKCKESLLMRRQDKVNKLADLLTFATTDQINGAVSLEDGQICIVCGVGTLLRVETNVFGNIYYGGFHYISLSSYVYCTNNTHRTSYYEEICCDDLHHKY